MFPRGRRGGKEVARSASLCLLSRNGPPCAWHTPFVFLCTRRCALCRMLMVSTTTRAAAATILLVTFSARFPSLVGPLFVHARDVFRQVCAVKERGLGVITRRHQTRCASHVMTIKKGLQLVIAAFQERQYLRHGHVVHVQRTHHGNADTIGPMATRACHANQTPVSQGNPFRIGRATVDTTSIAR